MRYRGDITPEEYAAMEDGYEQGRAAAMRNRSGYSYVDGLLDITAPMGPVEIEIVNSDSGPVIWVHTDGRSVLRICRISDDIILNDQREKEI